MPRNCIIWPPDKSTADEGSPCLIHRIERQRLRIGGPHSIQAHALDNYLMVIEFDVSAKVEFSDGSGLVQKGLPVGFSVNQKEVSRRGQYIDKGGYRLNPQDVEPPAGFYEGHE